VKDIVYCFFYTVKTTVWGILLFFVYFLYLKTTVRPTVIEKKPVNHCISFVSLLYFIYFCYCL